MHTATEKNSHLRKTVSLHYSPGGPTLDPFSMYCKNSKLTDRTNIRFLIPYIFESFYGEAIFMIGKCRPDRAAKAAFAPGTELGCVCRAPNMTGLHNMH